MRANRRRDTKPEVEIRRRLHAMGLRYRTDMRPEKSVRRHADIVFTKAKIAVFVDGCFWHGCAEHFIMPKTNRDYWENKSRTNMERDLNTNQKLKAAGWQVIRVWEHDPPDKAAAMIAAAWRTARKVSG